MAIFQNFAAGGSLREDCYYAISSSPEWQPCDVLCRSIAVDASGDENGVATWRNTTQGTVLLTIPVIGTDTVPVFTGLRSLVGSETLNVSGNPTGFAAIPPGANLAEVHVLDNAVISRLDGTPPTGNGSLAPVGRRANDGAYFELEERDEIQQFSVIRLGGLPTSDARLFVESFFQCSNDKND